MAWCADMQLLLTVACTGRHTLVHNGQFCCAVLRASHSRRSACLADWLQVMAGLAVQARQCGWRTLLLSTDKDLWQVGGWLGGGCLWQRGVKQEPALRAWLVRDGTGHDYHQAHTNGRSRVVCRWLMMRAACLCCCLQVAQAQSQVQGSHTSTRQQYRRRWESGPTRWEVLAGWLLFSTSVSAGVRGRQLAACSPQP